MPSDLNNPSATHSSPNWSSACYISMRWNADRCMGHLGLYLRLQNFTEVTRFVAHNLILIYHK